MNLRPCNDQTLCVVGFLVVAHVDLESFQLWRFARRLSIRRRPSSVLDPSVYTVKPGVYPSAALFAYYASVVMVAASRSVAISRRTVSSVRLEYPRKDSKLFRSVLSLQRVPVLVAPGRLSSRRPHRLLRSLSWAFAGLSPDPILRPPWNVVRKSPVEARASWLIRTCIYAALPFVLSSSSPFYHNSSYHNSSPNSATA